MALFHVWHFQPFQRLTLKLTGAVHCSMFYKFTKFPGRALNITWLIVYGKPHLRRLHPVFYPWGEVPPDFTPRSPDFVLQLAFDLKWPHSKFGLEPLKPRGAILENVFFSPFLPVFEMALSLALKLGRLPVWSMVYKCAKWNGQTRKVTWLMSLRKAHLKSRISPPPGFFPPGVYTLYWSFLFVPTGHIRNLGGNR